MIDRKDFIMLVLIGFFLAVALYPRTTSSVREYDPWLDYNDDGIVDVQDLYSVGIAFGAMGDPTKNVTVTNFPQIWNMNIIPHAFNVTFAIERTVGTEEHTYLQDISGYRQATIGINCSSTPDQLLAAVYWLVGGVRVQDISWIIASQESLYHTFDVQSEMIMITVVSRSGSSIYSLGLYATD